LIIISNKKPGGDIMRNELGDVLNKIGEKYKQEIATASKFYLEVDIGKQAEKFGYSAMKDKYLDVSAVVPLKQAAPGMKVMIDGRTFINYAQFESGIAVPEYVAREAGLSYQAYRPDDSMILNFA
jgi:hypothetical protein